MPRPQLRARLGWILALVAAVALNIVERQRASRGVLKLEPEISRSAAAANPPAVEPPVPVAPRQGHASPQKLDGRAANGRSNPHANASDALDLALYQALQITAPEPRRRALREIAEKLAHARDVVTAGDYVAALLGPDDRKGHGDAYAFTKVFADRLAARDPAAVIAWSKGLPESSQEMAYPIVVRHAVANDLRALGEWTRGIESAALRATVLRATGHELRRFDADERTVEWARELAASPDGPRFGDLVVEHWARRDFWAAAEWAATLSDESDRETAFLALAASTGAHAPATNITWAAGLPPSELRARAITRALSMWATTDPAAAAHWCDTHPTESAIAGAALPQIASAWLRRDHDAASRWLTRAPISDETKAYLFVQSAGHVSGRQ